MILTKELAIEYFRYKDGCLYWLKSTGYINTTGQKLKDTLKSIGYKQVSFFGKRYYHHQIIFLLHHGYIPKCIDHIDQNRANNYIENLREATHSINRLNSKISKNITTGYKNISRCNKTNTFVVTKMLHGKSVFHGKFGTLEDAKNKLLTLEK